MCGKREPKCLGDMVKVTFCLVGSLWELLEERKDEKRAFLLWLAVCVLVEDGNTGKWSCRNEERAGKARGAVRDEGQSGTAVMVSVRAVGPCPGMSPCAGAARPCEGCPPARRELSSSSPGGEPAWGC